MAFEPGQRVGEYEIQSVLGTGGMGRVYSARNIISNRVEAMKVLLPDYASEPELAARFMGEIRTLATLEHPNIAQLRTAFQFENQLVMVMEFVEGTTLEKLASQSRIPLENVLAYSTQVLSALSYAHSRGVTHRDIKPANIMITSHGLVKLMDFGIAKSSNDMQLTRPGTTMGSVYYMSPEQVRGGTVDARSDIYSFGVTLYEMLTGRRPFQSDTSYSVLNAQLNEAPTPPAMINPELSPELNNIVLRAMVKSPDGRFQTADEFRNALKRLQEAQPPANPQTTPSFAAGPAPQQGFAPVNIAAAAPASANDRGGRGLWIGFGAAAAIVALIAAATLLPHIFATHASPAQADTASSAPAMTAAANPAPDSPSGITNSSPASPSNTQPEIKPAVTGTIPGPARSTSNTAAKSIKAVSGATPQTENAAVPPPPPAASEPAISPQEMNEARNRLIDLGARADAARSGVQQIRAHQQAEGLDLRGDIVSAMSRLDSYMNEANRALGENDPRSANQLMDRAEKEVSTLQSFLGK